MVKKQQIGIPNKTSELDRFNLGFEYDKTITEVKREVRVRTFQ